MRILLTGACGFVGSTLARALAEDGGHQLFGLDNFSRPGSEVNRRELIQRGITVLHGDLRAASDLEALPACDWVIDAAANPSVLAGASGQTSSRQLSEHNLCGTLNLLEYCKRHCAGLILLSTSRVYSIDSLAALPVQTVDHSFRFVPSASSPKGVTQAGINEAFPTTAPISLYGATKLASETLALEYGETFEFPVFINRCGVLAGAGQFGRPDQGIFAYWINNHLRRQPLRYIGFGGQGYQVRDCLHPLDLLSLFKKQFVSNRLPAEDRIINVSGGAASAMSLRQLSQWCDERFGLHDVTSDPAPRRFDVPWMVLDHGKATSRWSWSPTTTISSILEEIEAHARSHPEWLELSASI